MNFKGYLRENGEVGSRNYVAVISSVVCVNEIVHSIVNLTEGSTGIMHHQGCCQLPPDLDSVTKSLAMIGANPNIGAVLIVSLGCEGVDADSLVKEISKTGKPVRKIVVQELGGSSKSIEQGINIVQEMSIEVSKCQKLNFDISYITMGIKCGASDSTSGLASNPVIGYIADKIVKNNGTVIFGETTEFIGAEHILAKRIKNEQHKKKLYDIVKKTEDKAKLMGVDMRRGQPTPGNIKGGLSSIEEKSLGAIVKSGTMPIEGVLDYNEKPKTKGLWIKDSPGREPEILTGMAIGGAQVILFSTGCGAPQGYPIVPVIKICGNPVTFNRMINHMDVNAGGIIDNETTIEQVGEDAFNKLLSVLSGELTKAEAIRYSKTMEIYTSGIVI